jgi:hypothetical protein
MAVNEAFVESGVDFTRGRLALLEDCYSRLRLKHFMTNIIR